MTGKTISPLRQRMIKDMSVRHFVAHTQQDYIRAVCKLTAFLGCSDGGYGSRNQGTMQMED